MEDLFKSFADELEERKLEKGYKEDKDIHEGHKLQFPKQYD